ncbi:probable WRKY transcription factor 2 [Lactuca sativa]|uniref:WRKY domain-containing protein n=1 Tax=Lactuca sativa TaxID=4236 RepID=A0A9R1X4S8_LACSA|nr:probable WRKY transcription factor 2 [Lactuca sativa]KAJ0195992.1 hypothetical protein LSAT_V11C700387070 [Lactuca sativa]
MGGFDDHGGIIGDWMPPSPSPRSFFAAMLGDDPGSRSVPDPPKHDTNNDTGFTFPGPNPQIGSENGDATKSSEFGDQKTSSRAPLVERMAARAGHNAPRLNTEIIKSSDNSQTQQSPYLFSPGVSPTSFLESPVFLSNSLVQPSPTTGKFQFVPNGNGRSSMMFLDSSNRVKENFFEDTNNTSFAFKPFPDSAPVSRDHVNPPFMSTQSFQHNETLVQSERQFPPQKIEPTQNETSSLHIRSGFLNGSSERSQEHHEDDADQRINGDIGNNSNSASSEDGYNWRKYGQKQVKGSEYPRSYYKCTHLNCPVKKKVERSHEGHITEIIYKGAHNHPKLGPTKRSGLGCSNMLSDMQGDGNDQGGNGGQWGQEGNYEVTSSGMAMQGQNGHFESSDAVDGSSTFSNDEEDDRATHGSVSLGYDGEGDESESKRRKVEAYAADVSGATRAIREPRVVVQTTSEVDILDDGYRWRKYGQKVVKGNPNPRSYYKCTSTGCTVRKHVERASHDLKSVITTYEGKHNHDVPAARNSSHANNNNNNNMTPEALSMPEPSRMQTAMARFDRAQAQVNHHYGLPGGGHGQMGGPTGSGTTHGYNGYPMSQQGPGGLAHMGLSLANHHHSHGKMPVLPVHHYLGQPQPLMLPKGEPKVEPMSDPGAPIYHQMMNRLPLGPQM